jgi:hypothetical protein
LFFFDLNAFHWEIYYQNKIFDFQPELYVWYCYYSKEFLDLIFYSLIFYLFFFFFFCSPHYINIYWERILFLRFLPFLLIFFFSFYFLGGELLLWDFFLIIFAYLFGETLLFLKIFLSIIKRKIQKKQKFFL